MSGNSNSRNGSYQHPRNDHAVSMSVDRRDSVRVTAPSRNMSVLSLAPPPSPAAFDRAPGGRFQLPPLKHSFSYHGASMADKPGKDHMMVDANDADAVRKRRILESSAQSASPVTMDSTASHVELVHSDPSPTAVMSVAHLTHPEDSGLPRHALQSPHTVHGTSHTIYTGRHQPPGSFHSAPASSRGLSENQSEMSFGTSPGHSVGTLSHQSTRSSGATSAEVATRMTSAESFATSPNRDEGVNAARSPLTAPGPMGAYQMMTLQTSSGTMQVPVDTQAASKFADEKRRRNAGASARFRERRKRKEAESSATISKLELRVKELSEDLDYYRQERDYFANAILQTPGGDRHFPRPGGSPRMRRRSHGFSAAESVSGESSNYFDSNPERQDGMYDGQERQDDHGMMMGVSNTPEPRSMLYPSMHAAEPSPSLPHPPPQYSAQLRPHTVDGGLPRPRDVYQRRDSFNPPSAGVTMPQHSPDLPRPWLPSPPNTGPQNSMHTQWPYDPAFAGRQNR